VGDRTRRNPVTRGGTDVLVKIGGEWILVTPEAHEPSLAGHSHRVVEERSARTSALAP
jgi:hypothetical protein